MLHFNLSCNIASLGRPCGHRAAFTGFRTRSSAVLLLPGARDQAPVQFGSGQRIPIPWVLERSSRAPGQHRKDNAWGRWRGPWSLDIFCWTHGGG
jgi:hypothetical protein